MGGTAIIVARIGALAFDARTGRLAALLFVASFPIVWAATDARPYAGATFCVVSSTYLLLRWFESGKLLHRVGYVVLCAATFYFNYYASAALAAPALYGFARRQRRGQMAWNWFAICILLLPLVPHMLRLASQSQMLSLAPQLPNRWLTSVVPGEVILGIASVAAIATRFARPAGVEPVPALRSDKGKLALVIGWWFFSPALFLGLTLLTDINALAIRYHVTAVPGQVLALGLGVRAVVGELWDRYIVVAVAVAAAITSATFVHRSDGWSVENWREAAAAIRGVPHDDGTPVLVSSGLIEGVRSDWLSDPEKSDYLTSVFSPYPVDGRLHALPLSVTNAWESQLLGVARRSRLLTQSDFFLVVPPQNLPMVRWFRDDYACGYTRSYVLRSDRVWIALFERGNSAVPGCPDSSRPD